MVGSFFRPEEIAEELVGGLMSRKKDRDKLAYKAFLLGRQLAALERERLEFYKEQADAAQQQAQMMMMLMNLQAQQKSPVLQGTLAGAQPPAGPPIAPPMSGGGAPLPMPGAPTGASGAPAVPPVGPLPADVPLPIPGQTPPTGGVF